MPSNTNTPKIDALYRRIAALRQLTEENGATVAEALLAAERIADMLARYDLDMSQVDLRAGAGTAEPYATREYDLGARRKPSIIGAINAIAAYTGTRAWYSAGYGETYRVYYFGQPAHTMFAEYLLSTLQDAIRREWQDFRLFEPAAGRAARYDFELAMVRTVAKRLRDLVAERRAHDATGHGLILQDKLQTEFNKLGLRLHVAHKTSRGIYNREAGAAGRDAGDRFTVGRPVTKQGSGLRALSYKNRDV